MRTATLIPPLSLLLAAALACAEEPAPPSVPTPFLGPTGWGYKDISGKVLVNPQFTYAGNFSEGLAVVGMGGELKPVSGEIRLGTSIVHIDRFKSVGAKYGYLDRLGNVAIRPVFDEARAFSEGLAAVQVKGKWGYIDHSGQLVIEAKFDEVQEFHEGLAPVRQDKKWGFIDRTGKLVIEPKFLSVQRFSEGLACVWVEAPPDQKVKFIPGPVEEIPGKLHFVDGYYGYIGRTGNYVIRPQFHDAGDFRDGLAKVQTDEGWGCIDHSGQYVVQPAK